MLKPGSIRGKICDVLRCVKWLTLFQRKFKTRVGLAFQYVVSSLLSSYGRAVRRDVGRGNALRKAIEGRKIPLGGLSEIRVAVKAQIEALKERIRNGDFDATDKRDYTNLLGLIVASDYSTDAKGRIGALNQITLRQVLRLLSGESTMEISQQFKTRAKYINQALTFTQETLQLLFIYYKYCR
jgi:hypothetical protein